VILSIERRQISPEIAVLEMNGRIIQGNNSRDVELKLAELLHDNIHKVIFDLKGVTVVDSTGVGILVVAHGKLKKEGGELRLAGATGLVEEVLKMTSVDKITRLYSTAEEAAAAF